MRSTVEIDHVDAVFARLLWDGKHVAAVNAKALLGTLRWMPWIRRGQVEEIHKFILRACQARVFLPHAGEVKINNTKV